MVKVYRSYLDETVAMVEEWFLALDRSLVVAKVMFLNNIQVVGKVWFLNRVQVSVQMWFVDSALIGVEVLFWVLDISLVLLEV